MEDIYKCLSCGGEYDGYHALKHYDEDGGGFCPDCASACIYPIDELEEEECE